MNILDLKRKALGWTFRCGGGESGSKSGGSDTDSTDTDTSTTDTDSTDTDTSTTDTNYSNEGNNHSTPTGTAPGNTQDANGGWSADTSTGSNSLGNVPELNTQDYSLSGDTKNPDSGLSATPGTSANPGDSLAGAGTSSGSGNGLTADVNTSADPGASLSSGTKFDGSGSAGLSVDGVRAKDSSFIDGRTSVYTPALGRTTFDQLSPAEQEMQARNILDGKPGYYNGEDPGFREKFIDAMNYGLDKTGLIGQSLKDLGVKPGMSFDEQRQFETNTPGAAQARYDRMNDIASGAANIAISMAPGSGLVKTGINMARNMENGMAFDKALSLAVSDSLKGYAAGQINKEFGKAIGADAAGLLSSYNRYAGYANMFGAGVPGINVGRNVVDMVAGPPSGPARTNSSGAPVLDSTGGQVYGGVGSGWTSDSAKGESATPSSPAVTTPNTPSPTSRNSQKSGFSDAKGFGQAFTSGVRAKYRR